MVLSYKVIRPFKGCAVIYEFDKRYYEGTLLEVLSENVYTVISSVGDTHIVRGDDVAPKANYYNYSFFVDRWSNGIPDSTDLVLTTDYRDDLVQMYRLLSSADKKRINKLLLIAKFSDDGFVQTKPATEVQTTSS